MIIDTHAHYNLPPFYPDWKTYWKEAQTHGIEASIVPGTDLETSKLAISIAKTDPHLYATVGIHPEEAEKLITESRLLDNWILELETLALDSSVVAIGECGLDFFRLSSDAETAKKEMLMQKTLFGKQIQLAKKLNKPLVVHCRNAYTEILDTINHFSSDTGELPHVVLHCMSGSMEYLNQALALGFYISFAGNVTYKNAAQLQELALHVPDDKILVETDMPFLPPQSHRGKQNMPMYMTETVEFLATLRGTTMEKLSTQLTENTRRFFAV